MRYDIGSSKDEVGEVALVGAPHFQYVKFHSLCRLVIGNRLVPPCDLRGHRDHHQFLGPSCLCPLLQPLSEEPVFKETAIYIPVFGRYAGEHVAECTESRCGYIG